MTNKEMKNTFVLVGVMILIVIEIYNIVAPYMFKIYTVDQYTFEDGSKITIDWNVYEDSEEYKNVRYYKGCFNKGYDTDFWYMSAEQWYRELYFKGGDDYAQYCATLKEWRW